MYNFIVNLFNEDDYNSLLSDDSGKSKNEKSQILVVPTNAEDSPFLIKYTNIGDEINDNPKFQNNFNNKGSLFTYFNLNNFINPTHNNSNNIGSNSALISHSPTHFKITSSFIDKDERGKAKQHPNGNVIINIPEGKINAFEKSVKEITQYSQFSGIYTRVIAVLKSFNDLYPENKLGLKENDFIVFLVTESEIEKYTNAVQDYTFEKILKYDTFKGACDNCGATSDLYMFTQGNMFDLGKGRKFLLRHPTRYKTNATSKSPENFNVCKRCAKNVYDFFEYIKKYKFYRYVIPTTVTIDKEDYRDYSSKPLSILKMLQKIYNNNHSQDFDYVMMDADPKIENIEFRYVNNFNYQLPTGEFQINDIPLSSTLKELDSKGKDGEITSVQKERTKSIFLMELNLLFNNTLAPSLFETDSKNLMKSLPSFIKLKIIEYNFIIRNFVYFQDTSFFEDKVYTKLFREMLSELVNNSNLRDEMKIGVNKIRFFLTIYFKYLHIEPKGSDTIKQYMELNKKIDDAENIIVQNDFEASYFMGQLFYYLLQVSKAENRLNLFTKYTMNVHDMDILKNKLITVLEKYSHNKYIDNNRKFNNLFKNVLAFEFEKSYEDNKIPMYTGYFDNNCLYKSKEEKDELESPSQEDE